MESGFQFKTVLHKAKRGFVYVMLFSVFVNLLNLAYPIYMLQVYDRVLPNRVSDTLIYLTLITIFTLGVLGFLMLVRKKVMIAISHWYAKTVSHEVLKIVNDQILQNNPMALKAVKDVGYLSHFLCSNAVVTFFDIPWIPLYIFVVFMLHPLLGVVAICGAVALLCLSIFNEYYLRHIGKESQELSSERLQGIYNALKNAEAVQGLGMSPQLISHWDARNDEVLEKEGEVTERSYFVLSIAKIVRLVIQVIILAAGGYLAMHGYITAGVMIVSSIITGKGIQPLEQSIGSWTAFVKAKEAYDNLQRYFSYPQRIVSDVRVYEPKGEIKVKDLFYHYPGAKEFAIQNVHFTLQPGTFLGVIGPTGSGKSTLIKLLVGALIPTRGYCRFDDIESSQWDRLPFGQAVGYMPQDVELFPGSVKENISRFLDDISDEEVIDAAKKAFSHETILHLQNGYETRIHTLGNSVSGGQLQRIALARCLFHDPHWLILDEPNSNLDIEGERALFQALEQAKKEGKTIVVVSQRWNILELSDQLLFLKNGIVAAYGSKEEVQKKIGVVSEIEHT